MHHSESNPTVPRRLPALLIPLLLLACKDEGIKHYRVAKTVDAPKGMPSGHPPLMGQGGPMTPAGMQGEVEAPPRPSGPGSLQWTLPTGWTETGQSGIRYATLKAPIVGELDISVTVLGGMAGGETANVNRWRGQISLPPLDDAAVAKAKKIVKAKAGQISVFDFTSEGASKRRMIAGLLTTPDGNTWFVKMVGEAGAVAKAAPDFARILESLRLG